MIIHMEQIQTPKPKIESAEPVRVCALTDLPLGLGRAFRIGTKTIALFKTRSGQIFAVDNRCPHKNGPLAEGMLAGNQIVCPLHAFRYDGTTGQCDQPDACAVTTYPVEVRDGSVYLTTETRRHGE